VTDVDASATTTASILIVDGDIVSRHVIADYLRDCGYAVVEAANTDEAYAAMIEPTMSIDVVLCDVAALGSRSGFQLASWVRVNRPDLEVRLAASVDAVALTAAQLCESGPHLKRPFEPEAVVDYINRLRASRTV
jgi:CheY-like chemotaxis protein